MSDSDENKLLIVWTGEDREVALNMVFMYGRNAKRYGWWEDIYLLVWGPSQKLLAEDEELQTKLAEMIDLGVRIGACKACADSYVITEQLEELGVEVFYSGQFLTDWIRSDASVITF